MCPTGLHDQSQPVMKLQSSHLRFNIYILLALLWSLSAPAQNYTIILGRPTAKSVTASVLFDQDVDYYLEYGSRTGSYGSQTPSKTLRANITDEPVMEGLTADSEAFYRLRYRRQGTGTFMASPEYRFHTQRQKGSPFVFTVESDEHLYDKKGIRSMYQVTLANQALDRPDFMLSLGDIFGDDHYPFTITSSELDALHKDYRPFLGSICHSIPFFVCLGNHEGENNYYMGFTPPDNLAIRGTYWRKYYYPNPFPDEFYSGNTDVEPYGIGNPENYYAWTWGDALFVVLDAYRYQSDKSDKPQGWDWTIGRKQYDWLKSTLENSSSKYKFVFAHHVRGQGRGGASNAKLYEWGGYEADGKTFGFDAKRPGWGKPIHQLFRDNGVSIFFQGHDHLFAHEVLDGIHYQEVPMPSDSTYEIGMLANADAYDSDTVDGTGHIRVSVSSACVTVDYVKAYLPKDTTGGKFRNRDIGFSYTIGNCLVTGIDDIWDEPDDAFVRVFPNPASDRLQLVFREGTGKKEIGLSDASGSLVMKGSSDVLQVGHLPPGIYYLQIRTDKYFTVKKIRISHCP